MIVGIGQLNPKEWLLRFNCCMLSRAENCTEIISTKLSHSRFQGLTLGPRSHAVFPVVETRFSRERRRGIVRSRGYAGRGHAHLVRPARKGGELGGDRRGGRGERGHGRRAAVRRASTGSSPPDGGGDGLGLRVPHRWDAGGGPLGGRPVRGRGVFLPCVVKMRQVKPRLGTFVAEVF